MPHTSLNIHALVLYKQRPAVVTQVGPKKIAIQVEDETLSVRPKDVTLLHPGPLPGLHALTPVSGELLTAWELLAGGATTLAELAELAFGDFTPQTAWAAWREVVDGLRFSGEPDAIIVHTAEVVAQITAARAAKAAEEAAWAAFLARAAQGVTAPEDGRYLQEVVAVAHGQQAQSKALQALGQPESRESAHALLLRLGVWAPTYNPYPARAGLPTHPPDAPLPPLPDEPRRDLTHLVALAIDDAGSSDPDDALSWENGRLWVHVADAAALIPPDSPADLEARARGANLYLPEGTVPMLPPAATQRLALGLEAVSPALSFGLALNAAGEVVDLEITPSWVRVTRLSYADAAARLAEEPLRALYRLAQQNMARRRASGAVEIDLPEVKVRVVDGQVQIIPLPALPSRDLVREAMLLTGEAVARYALQHAIPLPFTTQETAVDELPPADTPAEMFALRRLMKPSRPSSQPGPHAGLGLALYVQTTSPLRRYLDLVVHQQLRAHLRGEALLDEQALMARVGAADAVSGDVRRAERLSNQHWTLIYLQQHPAWEGEGVVVDQRGSQDQALLPALGLDTPVHRRGERPLDARLRLKLKQVDLPELRAHFHATPIEA